MHYLDNSATTPLCEQAKRAMIESMERFGNPSSLHALGAQSLSGLDAARCAVARRLGCQPKELIFTSCGSESNNAALIGAARALRRRGKRIITTAVEHHSVLSAAHRLEEDGFDVVYLKPDENGVISAGAVESALTDDTVLVSVMYVNNETGAVMPVTEIANLIKRSGSSALFHCDCVQAFGKLPFNARTLGADLISVSGHKVHGPKGVGALYIRQGCRISPLILGGGQERGMRSGTEATVLIDGFAAAADAMPDLGAELKRITALRDEAVGRLRQIDSVVVNSSDDALPYIINFSVRDIRSEVMLHWLESRQIYVSSGSACAKGESSHVLAAQGIDRSVADSAVRVSMSHLTDRQDLQALTAAVEEGEAALIKRR